MSIESVNMCVRAFGVLLMVIGVLPGCAEDEGGNGFNEVDTGTRGNQQISQSCLEGCTGPLCLEKVTGRLLDDEDMPIVGDALIKFCTPNCNYLSTDELGRFEYPFPGGCGNFDFTINPIWDLEVLYAPDDARSHYVVALEPTQEQVSDEGTDDFVWDLGDHYIFDLPEESVAYEAPIGAIVEHEGLSFEIMPYDLGTAAVDIKVFKAPLENWKPPFIDNPYYPVAVDEVDALYYVTPYWTPVGDSSGEGVEYRFDPPEDWLDGEPGKAFVLGDWYSYYLEHPDKGKVVQGAFEEWGAISWDNGKIVTPPVPVFGWIGIAKD